LDHIETSPTLDWDTSHPDFYLLKSTHIQLMSSQFLQENVAGNSDKRLTKSR